MGIVMLRQEKIVDCFLIVLILAITAMTVYHPFFWGDELEPWRLISKNLGDYFSSFLEYSQYKPRLIFNAAWELIPFLHASRGWAMALMLFGEALAALSVYYFATKIIPNHKVQIWLLLIAFISSRFSIIIWFDYLSGSIETLSFAFFISGLAVLTSCLERVTKVHILSGFLLFSVSVFIHERYIPAIIVTVSYLAFFHKEFGRHRILLLLLGVLPLIAFYFCNLLLGKHSIAMGTAGRTISVNHETFISFITYISNVLFQTNFGLPWFVGNFNMQSDEGKTISIFSISIFSCIYAYSFFKKSPLKNKHLFIVCILSALALILIASLPGLDRQESRWMHPVYGLILIASIIYFSSKISQIFLAILIVFNCIYIFSGSLNSIANVVASNTAHKLGVAITTIEPSKTYGAIIGESSTNWIINAGNKDGEIFSFANNLNKVRLSSINGDVTNIDARYGFVLIRTGKGDDFVPIFKIMSSSEAKYIASPNSVSPNDTLPEKVIGDKNTWVNWRLQDSMRFQDGVLLSPGVAGFLDVPIEELNGNILVYYATAITEGTVPMRIQINWVNRKGEFISAFIKVVDVDNGGHKYTALVSAPPDAVKGLVYVSLHNKDDQKVRVDKISIVNAGN